MAYHVPPPLNTDRDCPEKILVSFQTRIKEVIKPCDIANMMELEFCENKADKTALSYADHKFLNIMKEGIHMNDSHYEMPLPFKHGKPHLPNNRKLALHRLNHLRKKLESDERYRNHYFAFIRDIIDKGHAERVPVQTITASDHVWYIPHHGVYHPKKREKIRVVFDCSAKYNGESLNDHLLQGPDLTNTVVGVLNRFRKELLRLFVTLNRCSINSK